MTLTLFRTAAVFLSVLLHLAFAAHSSDGAVLYHTDDFSSGTVEGWGGGANPTFVSDGGPEGAGDGFLRIGGVGSPIATHVRTSPWTGDYLNIGASAVSVDFMLSAAAPAPFEMRAVILGPDTQNRRTSRESQTVAPDGIWRRYTFSLAEDDLVVVQGSTDYATALTSVERFMFRHDPHPPEAGGTVAEGTLGLDNISLIPEPAPGGLLVLSLSILLVAWGRRAADHRLGSD